jgi:bifunctional UDP-N-acetylglucosamine pyrophosphorylase/glucosamine-1-phosphate N-acetyltransferase
LLQAAEKDGPVTSWTHKDPQHGILVFPAGLRQFPAEEGWVAFQKGLQAKKMVRDPAELFILSDYESVAALSLHFFQIKREECIAKGVMMLDPTTVYIEDQVLVQPDAILDPNVMLKGQTTIASGAHIGMGVVVNNSFVGNQVEIKPYSVIEGARIGARCSVGPFAHLREGTVLGEDARIGNFVETKKAVIQDRSKASHLAYLGDAHIGRDCNIGAGTITCNYDGVQKHQTILGDGVFIGSDSQLVAPVQLGNGAYVAAGSCVTRDVPSEALALARSRQVNKEGMAAVLRERAKRAATTREKGSE